MKTSIVNQVQCDITTINHGVIAHGVNCQGVMGSGVALSLRNKYDMVYTEYKQFCETSGKTTSELLGVVQIVEIVPDTLYVANCFTQLFYGKDKRKYADPATIEEVLEGVAAFAEQKQLPLFIPEIGCGYGGLSWSKDVYPIVSKIVTESNLDSITVCKI